MYTESYKGIIFSHLIRHKQKINNKNPGRFALHISFKQLVLVITVGITFLPYAYLFNMPINTEHFWYASSVNFLQIASVAFVLASYVRTKSKMLRLFWQFLALAVIGALVSTIYFTNVGGPTGKLLLDFSSLFSYFFILLAIETTPHLSDAQHNKYISGRVPAIFFTLICFSYFILLPTEFSDNSQTIKQSSALFNIIITSLIFIRLTMYTLCCKNTFWIQTYGLLAIGTLAILLDNILSFLSLLALPLLVSEMSTSLLRLLPYCMLILAANISLNNIHPPKLAKKTTYPEMYILFLGLVVISFHIAGLEQQQPYITHSLWHSVVVGIWLIIMMSFIAVITNSKRLFTLKFKTQIKQINNQKDELNELNLELTSSIINSEDKAIVRASNNAILTTTINGEILSGNPAAVQLFQHLEHELKGANVKTCFSSNDHMHYFFDFRSNVYSLQRKELGISVECTARRSDDTEFPVQAEVQWAEREDNPIIVITFINLTARKLAEKQALDLKDKFIANISHEFRTPLTIINGILDRYLSNANSVDESKELTTAKRNGLRLVRMVEQLLELSRLTDNPQMAMSRFRLSTLMAMPIDSFARLAKQSELSFSANIPDNLWLECDAQAFEKIIFNLLANAIKYTRAGGSIKVNAYYEEDTIILDVIDTGIGIDQASQEKIFERFQRADDQKNQAIFGVGIGLSLVNELVKAHQWRINLVSEYNQGSKFSLSIPLATPVAIESALPIGLSENEVSYLLVEQTNLKTTLRSNSQHVILVIEDNLDMQSHIKQVIEQQHHCLLTTSGEQGISLAQEFIPDLIVCDIMLTGIDGFEVLKQIKQNELTAHIPVILLTARSDLDSRLHGLNLQADEYLSKPFNQQELLVRIENLIENRRKLQQTYVEKYTQGQKEARKESSVNKVSQLTINDEPVMSLDEKFIDKLENVIAKMYTETDLGSQQLASEMAMSERQLQRKIKVLLGITPNNFIKEFRLLKAQHLLTSGAQIGRIALDVGFSSQTYFGRCFKESYQCTPKQYQQQHIKQQ